MTDNSHNVCTWIGEGEKCRHPTIFGKSYCEQHHERVYTVLFPEMATYIIEAELNTPTGSEHNN